MMLSRVHGTRLRSPAAGAADAGGAGGGSSGAAAAAASDGLVSSDGGAGDGSVSGSSVCAVGGAGSGAGCGSGWRAWRLETRRGGGASSRLAGCAASRLAGRASSNGVIDGCSSACRRTVRAISRASCRTSVSNRATSWSIAARVSDRFMETTASSKRRAVARSLEALPSWSCCTPGGDVSKRRISRDAAVASTPAGRTSQARGRCCAAAR